MGETPIAIVQTLTPNDQISELKGVLRDRVIRELGTSFALSMVVMLDELRLEDFPYTASGKVSKAELKQQVSMFMTRRKQSQNCSNRSSLVPDDVIAIWANLLGCAAEDLDPLTDASRLADSLTIMRFCYDVERELGKKIFVCRSQRESYDDCAGSST